MALSEASKAHQWPGCISRNKVKSFLNKRLSNYRPVTSASWEGSAPSLFPNEDCRAGRWIPQLTKQLVNNRTGRGQRLSFEDNESALQYTSFFGLFNSSMGLAFFSFSFLFHFLSLDETGGDSQLQFKRRGELTPVNDVHMGCDLL